MSSRIPSLWRERLISPLTWHYAAFIVLMAAVIVLATRFGMDWSATDLSSTRALAAKQVELKAVDLQTAPLRGLDKRVEDSRAQMHAFYSKRIPPSYSSIATRIGELALKGPVRLTRVQYTQGAVSADLTEITMDAGITGDYQQIMRFVNSLERDQTFFVIRGMALTGQQSGMVNLRLRVSTWLRPADVPSGLPPTPQPGDAAAAPSTPQGKEGK
jgi:Tfp pilus assembly protein PilO